MTRNNFSLKHKVTGFFRKYIKRPQRSHSHYMKFTGREMESLEWDWDTQIQLTNNYMRKEARMKRPSIHFLF